MPTPWSTSVWKSRSGLCGRARRGAALLEVVVALSILLLAMGVVGMAFNNGQLYVERAERTARATQMTQKLVGLFSTGLTVVGEQEATGTFGAEAPPDMCWRVAATPANQIPGLINLEIEIFMGAPESKPEEREHVLTTYAQQAVFVPLNMQRDFGMSQEQLDQITQSIPGGAEVFNPTSFDPRSVARSPMELLKELLPILLQAFGGQAVAGNLNDIMKAVESGDAGALQDLAQQAGQPNVQPPPPPPQPPPGQPQNNDVPKKPRPGGGGKK